MLRFRFTDDEKRFLLHTGQVHRLLASRLTPGEMSQVWRALGQAYEMLLFEGVRQGVAVAKIGEPRGPVHVAESLPPLALHAVVYGTAPTPLYEKERTWVEGDHPWLDPGPMNFAIDEVAAEATEAQAPRVSPDSLAIDEALIRLEGLRARTIAPPEAVAAGPEWTEEQIAEAAQAWAEEHEGSLTSPALLDQARDTLLALRKQGFEPDGWAGMIVRLHVELGVDAAFLDLQMGTVEGMTVLAQAGYIELRPPAGFEQGALFTEGPPASDPWT